MKPGVYQVDEKRRGLSKNICMLTIQNLKTIEKHDLTINT